jgi:hypothetical protein
MALLRGPKRHFRRPLCRQSGSQAAKLTELTSKTSGRFQPPAARQGAIYDLSVVRCPLSVAKAVRNLSASATREASNGPGTRDQGQRPPWAGAKRGTDQGQRTTDKDPPEPARCLQPTTDKGQRLAKAGAMTATDNGQRTTDTGPPGPDEDHGQRCASTDHRVAMDGNRAVCSSDTARGASGERRVIGR